MATSVSQASVRQESTVEINAEELVNTVAHEEASLAVRRYFTIAGRDPFDEIDWETRHAFIPGKDKPAFEQKDVEFPGSGRRPRRTSSRRSTSAAACPHPSASAPCAR